MTSDVPKKIKVKTKAASKKIPKDAFYATGKRKSAIARVWMYPGTGQIQVNGKSLQAYLCREAWVSYVMKPLEKVKLDGKYDIQMMVSGGGLAGQAGACQLGVSRAILTANESFRRPLREIGALTRDARIKERKKYGLRGARKKPTYRKR